MGRFSNAEASLNSSLPPHRLATSTHQHLNEEFGETYS